MSELSRILLALANAAIAAGAGAALSYAAGTPHIWPGTLVGGGMAYAGTYLILRTIRRGEGDRG